MDEFLQRGMCGPWPLWLMEVYIGGNLLIATAYMAIPLAIYVSMRGRARLRRPPSQVATRLFIAFLLMCGMGHLLDGVGAFYWPNYYLFAWWHLATGVVSWATALALPGAIREELQRISDRG